MTGSRKFFLASAGFLAGVTVIKLVMIALSGAGLGDAEALYAAYTLHPQWGYLDHPPAVAWMIRATTMIAGGDEIGVRLGPMFLLVATGLFLHDLARRISGYPKAGLLAVVLMCATPAGFLAGLASTPDALSSFFWVIATWLVVRHVQEGTPDRNPLRAGLLLGAVLGAGLLAKYTNVLLVPALLVFVAARRRKWILRYALVATLVAAMCAVPVIVWSHSQGWAPVLHRMVWTQREAGISFRNAGALVGGQLLYMSPVVMALVVLSMVRLWKDRASDTRAALAALAWIPAIALWALCMWSRVAEPHWPAVAYLPVLAVVAEMWANPATGRMTSRTVLAGTCLAAALTAAGLVLAATPLGTRLGLVEARTDITNELYGWNRVGRRIREVTPPDAIIIGPHWTLCAQLAWALRDEPASGRKVGCVTREFDDWDIWLPIDTRDPAIYPKLHYVSDGRFEHIDASILTLEASLLAREEITRGGKTVRTIRIWRR